MKNIILLISVIFSSLILLPETKAQTKQDTTKLVKILENGIYIETNLKDYTNVIAYGQSYFHWKIAELCKPESLWLLNKSDTERIYQNKNLVKHPTKYLLATNKIRYLKGYLYIPFGNLTHQYLIWDPLS